MSTAALAHEARPAEAIGIRKGASSLRVNRPGDSYEHEADRAAEQVVSGATRHAAWSLSRIHMQAPLQRQCSCSEECEECKEKALLQREAHGGYESEMAPSAVYDVLRGAGRPLDHGTRSLMESRFGYDFGSVRVFNDSEAAHSARAVAANAYTVGDKIVFNQGKYSPDSHGGRKLLAHELAHVVQQSHGGAAPKASGEPALESEARRVSSQVDAAGQTLAVRQRSGIGIARDPVAGAEPLIEVKFPDGVKQLTQSEFDQYKDRAVRSLRADLNGVASLSENGRKMQHDLLDEYQGDVDSIWDVIKKPKALIGIASDIKGGVTPPFIGIWGWYKPSVAKGLAACDKGDLRTAAYELRLANQSLDDALEEWNKWREGTIGGAEGVVNNLETVRDVSFAVALAAGAAVAAPVIAASVGAAGFTGVGATALTATGTAAVTGTGGAVLGGGSTALGSYAATGHVDLKAVKRDAVKFAKQGVVTGLTAGLGTAISGAGTAAKLAQPLVQTALKRCLTEAGINVAGEVTTELLDKAVPPEESKQEQEPKPKALLPAPARAALTGCVSGALGVPVAKLGRTGAKATELAVGAGVAYGDARLSGQSNRDALIAAGQATLTSAAIARGHAGTEHAKAASKAKAAAAQHAAASRQPEHATAAPKSAESKAAHPPEPAVKSPTEKFIEKQKAATGHEGSPAILKEDAKAKAPIGDGHEAVVTPEGIGRCSPSPCPVIHVEFAKELKAHPWAKERYAEIMKLRQSNPALAAEQAARFIKSLEVVRRSAARGSGPKYVEPSHVAGPDVLGEALSEPGLAPKGSDRKFGLGVGKERQQHIQEGKKNFVLDRAMTFDIDEVLPVGQKDIKPQRATARAQSAENRQLLDPNTNQRTKGLGIDKRELPSNRQPREPVSVTKDPHALVTHRFSEIHEMKSIFDQAVASIKEPGKLKPTELKAVINRETRRIITEGKGPDAVAVRKALTEIGFEHKPGVGFALNKNP